MTLAVIMSMRKHVGIIVAVIGIAIVSFLLMDAINSNLALFGGEQGNVIGEVDGRTITYEEFNQENTELEKRLIYFQGYWQDPTFDWNEMQRHQIRDLAWEQVVENELLEREYNRLGLSVNVNELERQILSANPNPQVRNFYSQVVDNNPNAFYNPNQMSAVIGQIRQLTPNDQAYVVKDYYLQLEQFIKQDLLRRKYIDLIDKSVYVPSWKANLENTQRGTTASIEYVSVPYASVNDSEVKPTEEELEAYLKNNKGKFKGVNARSIEYAIFNITPTALDTATVLQWISERMDRFQKTPNDSIFIKQYSETPYSPVYYSQEQLMSSMADSIMAADTATFIGPYLENGKFKVAKVIDKQVIPDSVKVSHVLASIQRYGTLDSAQTKIDSIKGLLDAGTPFDSLVAYSDDQSTAVAGGDLGWVAADQELFKDFYNAIFIEHNQGEIFTVKTGVGVHLVRIDSASAKAPKVKLALLERTITPGTATRDSMYNVASRFYTQNNITDSFSALLSGANLMPRYLDLTGGEINIPGVDVPARAIVRWAFEAEEGDTQLFKEFEGADNKYVIAHLTNISEKGNVTVNDFREELVTAVIQEKKAKIIKEKIAAAGNNLDQIASKANGQKGMASNVSFSSPFIEGLGVEPVVAATATALKPNTISKPIEGNNGVYVIKVTNKADAPAQSDLTASKQQIRNNIRSRFGSNIIEELKSTSQIEDNRYKYF